MKDTVVVITGGSAGVGRATAREFAKNAYRVGIIARDEDRLKTTQTELQKIGTQTAIYSADVADHRQIEKAARYFEDTLGPIDVWINNATTTVFSPIKKITPEEFKRVTEVTYLGTVYGTLVALKRMLPRNSGTIIQVGSALAYRAIPLQAPYSGAKFATRGFTDSLRVELLHDKKNIHLTMVQLPALNTPQFSWSRTHMSFYPQPVPPIFQPELAAEAILFAATNRRREVWVGQPSVATILMNKFFPGFVDRYLALTGYESQIVPTLTEHHREGNLFKPTEGNLGAHGIFDLKASSQSLQFTFEKIPFFHYISDPLFGVGMAIGMVPHFLKKLFEKNMEVAKSDRRTAKKTRKSIAV